MKKRLLSAVFFVVIISLFYGCSGTLYTRTSAEQKIEELESASEQFKKNENDLIKAIEVLAIGQEFLEPLTELLNSLMYVDGIEVGLEANTSTEAKILTALSLGQKLELHSITDGWSSATADVIEEYIAIQYLDETGSEVRQEPEVIKSGRLIAIDPGHQRKGNGELEPIGPGAAESKPKVASGTAGVHTKVPEYQLTLDVSLMLRDELLQRGYEVFMIRETHDVNISNRERAVMAAEAGADILVRIHANGSANSKDNGILTVSPTEKNPYISSLYDDSYRLSEFILDEVLSSTGANSKGVWETDSMSGINWSAIPVTIVEMGFMSNPTEDELMQTESYQNKLVAGIANGIDNYFDK